MSLSYFLYFLVVVTFKFMLHITYVSEKFLDRTLPVREHYDYIIVGSGSAGSVISSDLNGKILLLEAGGNAGSLLVNIPIFQPLFLQSDYDWKYQTTPQTSSCKGLNFQKCNCPTGKILSGTHRLNNMIYHRGYASDYKHLMTSEEAETYFENYEKSVPISEINFKSSVSHDFINAAKELGFDDFSYTNLTQLHGRRYTPIHNWWKSVEAPEVCLNAHVTRILFDQTNKRQAVGVEFIKNYESHYVYATKIILSAGTFGTPKILLHSGIGPKKHLQEIGIEMLENLPVGENLQDHVTTGIDLLLNQTIGTSIYDVYNPIKLWKYLSTGRDSPLALGGAEVVGFVKLRNESITPDLSFLLVPLMTTADFGLHLRKAVNLKFDLWNDFYDPLIGQPGAMILPIVLHPASKGTVKLKSKNYDDPPLIDPRYLESVEDVKKLIAGIRIIQKFIETSSLKKFNAEIIPKALPGCEKEKYDSDEYWECYVRHLTFTMYHPVGTCKMGDFYDNSTVVLKNFQVKNIDNLYVVDASIIQNAPSANPHALIAMLAEKFVHDMNMIDDIN